MLRLVRGAMLTPWFAVSVGIVIATTLTLTRPHPAITFPPSDPGTCSTPPCISPSVSPSPPMPAIRQGVILPAPGRDAYAQLGPVTVRYELLYSASNQFTAAILIVSHHPLGQWDLKFSLPRATVTDIMWARWNRYGRDGVVVTGAPVPWSVSSDQSAADQVRIIVMGAGTPGRPAGCRFDGQTCRFRILTNEAEHTDIGSFGSFGSRYGAHWPISSAADGANW